MLRVVLMLGLLCVLGGCATAPTLARRAAEVAARRQSVEDSCPGHDCARASPLTALARLDGDATGARHHVALLEDGTAALAVRLNLIAAANDSIDIQTFILTEDQSGRAVIDALLAAAKRGVKVRLLTDQLFSLDDVGHLAWLATAHRNFEVRLYNPTFAKARTGNLEFAWSILCCFSRFNQRMHNKLFLVDDRYAVVGGRNLDDRYYGLSETFNYADRDVLVTGPETRQMSATFALYWNHPSAVPLTRLRDVADHLVRGELPPPPPAPVSAALDAIRAAADNDEWLRQQVLAHALTVDAVQWFADSPAKTPRRDKAGRADLSREIGHLIDGAERSIVIQTPYLVLSRGAEKGLRRVRNRHPDLDLRISTNSLASTDAFYVYAISYKYRRRYLEHLKPHIYEYRPFAPTATLPIEPDDLVDPWLVDEPPDAVVDRLVRHPARRREPVPLRQSGTRRGLHGKSIVIDHRVSLIGSHNFDPRSTGYNTESGLIIDSVDFAARVEQAISVATAPEQSWTVARRRLPSLVEPVNRGVERVSESLPIFDLWPFRYATSYALRPGCSPVDDTDPRFAECYEAVGDFPEVDLTAKQIYTRLVTAFGSSLTPIL